MNQETVAVVYWYRVAQLLEGPLSGGVLRDIGMQDSAACVFHHR
jgi:hypothetical protein